MMLQQIYNTLHTAQIDDYDLIISIADNIREIIKNNQNICTTALFEEFDNMMERVNIKDRTDIKDTTISDLKDVTSTLQNKLSIFHFMLELQKSLHNQDENQDQ